MLLLLCCFLLIAYVYWKLARLYNFWTDRGIKQRKQIYLLGDFSGVFLGKEAFADALKAIYNEFPEERYVGIYQTLLPTLMIRDLELIKRITIKDFDHFVDHRQFIPDGLEPLWSNNLFALKGNKWRHMRGTLSPSFTTGKMKMLHPLICECARNFVDYFTQKGDDLATLNFRDISSRFTSDVIASIVFCVKCDSLKDPHNEFYLRGYETVHIFKGFLNTLRFFVLTTTPKLAKFLRLSFFSARVREFFLRVVKDNIKIREEHKLVRHDMLHLLLEAKKGRSTAEENEEVSDTGFATVKETTLTYTKENVKPLITDEDISAQGMVFLFGGFDTISELICFMAHELAVNTDVQNKLRCEIDAYLSNFGQNVHYETVVKLKYMDMVMSETLRKWPPAFFIERTCVKPYTIQPERSNERAILIQKGDVITIPISALHFDPQYYEQPQRFDPERFNDQNKTKIKPSSYLPFGSGPRNCIGSRFALLTAKVFFFHLLSKFELVTVDQTQVPLKLKKRTLDMEAEKGFWIGLKRRSPL